MPQEIVIAGRIVQGQVKLKPKVDDQNRPVMDKSTPPKQVIECYIGLAVPKNSADWNTAWAAMYAEARGYAPWANLFDANGQMVLRDFAWKFIDGDGVDAQGKPYSQREGFAGHYVLKLATRYLPKCYPAGQYGAGFEMAEPDKFIKCGDYVRAIIHVAPNEVQPGGQAKPGLYLSPNKLEHIGKGKEIESGGGMSAEEGFGKAGPVALPPGATPVGAYTPAAAAAPMPPGAAPVPPGMPGAAPTLPPPGNAMPTPPPARTVVIAPQYAAQGISVAGLHAQGFTDDVIVANGWGTWQ